MKNVQIETIKKNQINLENWKMYDLKLTTQTRIKIKMAVAEEKVSEHDDLSVNIPSLKNEKIKK